MVAYARQRLGDSRPQALGGTVPDENWKVVKRHPSGFAVINPEGQPIANCPTMTEVGTHIWIGNMIRRDIKGNVTYANVEQEPIYPHGIARAAVEHAEKKQQEKIARRERRNRARA